jgi:NADPH-dependent 2,4-dienoyl-CoA reductase/sulfur reductase-like enzyme
MGQSSAGIVIVGAGHAGGVLLGLLRQYGHAGSITPLGAEAIAPRQRPPLSKAWLKGEATAESLALKPFAFYAEHQITFRPRATVTRIDRLDRTRDPAIFAIGDATCRPMPYYDRMFGPESVPSALEQAKQAACAITGRPAPAPEVLWNWSDQYDLKLQMAGLAFDADQIVMRGDPDAAHFAVFHPRGDQVRAVEAINAPAEFMAGRSLIASQKPVDPGQLRNLAISIKAFV